MAATPKPTRTRMKKMASESRESGKHQNKSIQKAGLKERLKTTKSSRTKNFMKSQY